MSAHPHFLWKSLFKRGNSQQKAIAEVLKDNILFQTLTTRELGSITGLVYERVYQANEPIFKQNDRGLGMYIIAKGRVAIRTETTEGDVLVTVLTEGDFLGEIALVEPNNIRTASAIPLERTVLVGFFKPDLEEILERMPATGVKILFQLCTVLGKRLHETTESITAIKKKQKPAPKPKEDVA